MSLPLDTNWRNVSGRTNTSRFGYLLRSGLGSDVVLIVGETKEVIRAHKVILMITSSVFEKIFTDDPYKLMLENPDVEPAVFRLFLKFIYTGEWPNECQEIVPLLNAANYYNVPDLSTICYNKLRIQLNKQNALKVFKQAVLYNENGAQCIAKKIICEYAYEIVESDEFLELSSVCLEKLLALDDLAVNDEIQLFEALMRWGEAECYREGTIITPNYCYSVLQTLISLIRFPTMDPANFSMKVVFRIRNILTKDQLLALSLYFNNPNSQKSAGPVGVFDASPRKYHTIDSAIRYTVDRLQQEPEDVYDKETDSICFQVSHPGKLVSVGFVCPYADVRVLEKSEVSLVLWDCLDKRLATAKIIVKPENVENIFQVPFETCMPLKPGAWYIVECIYSKGRVKIARNYSNPKASVTIYRTGLDNVLVKFRNEEGNEMTKQFPQLCFEF